MKKVFLVLALAGMALAAQSQTKTSISKMETKSNPPIQFDELYFVLISNKLEETRKFYEELFGFKPLFESSWFYYLQSPGSRPFGLALMAENHPTTPPKLPAFQAKSGIFMTLQVTDAEKEFSKMKSLNAKILLELKSEPWGQKRFSLEDPNGLFIDVVEQTQPEKEWWDQYMKP